MGNGSAPVPRRLVIFTVVFAILTIILVQTGIHFALNQPETTADICYDAYKFGYGDGVRGDLPDDKCLDIYQECYNRGYNEGRLRFDALINESAAEVLNV